MMKSPFLDKCYLERAFSVLNRLELREIKINLATQKN